MENPTLCANCNNDTRNTSEIEQNGKTFCSPDCQAEYNASGYPTVAATTTPEAKTAFVIDSLDRLTWYLRKVGNLQAEKARIKAQSATMLAQIDSDLNNLTGHFGQQAEQFTRQELERKGGKRKSITTLQGTVGFRTQPAKLAIGDDDAALVHAHAMHLTTATICTGAYLKAAQEALEATGELLPGVEVMDAREKFTVSFKGDADSE